MNFELLENLDQKNFKQIVNLYIDCFTDSEKGEDWTFESASEYFQDKIKEKSVFYVLKDEREKICATIMGGAYEECFLYKEIDLRPEKAFYISLVAANPAMRRKGLAQKLMNLVEKDCKEKFYSSFIVRCRKENLPVQKLFFKNEFSESLSYFSELGGVYCERLILEKKFHG